MSLELSNGSFGEFTTTPLVHFLFEVGKELGVNHFDKLGKSAAIFLADILDSNARGVVKADDLTKASLALDNAVWDIELAAESWEPNDDFDWVDIVSDNDELSLLGFDKGGNVLDTVNKSVGSSTSLWSKGLFALGGGLLKAVLLLLLGFWVILFKELEDLESRSLVKGVVEVVDCRWDLQALHEDAALALDLDILWPFGLGSHVWGNSGFFLSEETFLFADFGISNLALWSRFAAHKKRPS